MLQSPPVRRVGRALLGAGASVSGSRRSAPPRVHASSATAPKQTRPAAGQAATQQDLPSLPKTPSWSQEGRLYEYTSTAKPDWLAPVPIWGADSSPHEHGPSRIIPLDPRGNYGFDFHATSPNLLASYVRVCDGETLQTTARATSQVFVVIRGSGHTDSEFGRLEWGPGDVFALPACAHPLHHTAAAAAVELNGSAPPQPPASAVSGQQSSARQGADGTPAHKSSGGGGGDGHHAQPHSHHHNHEHHHHHRHPDHAHFRHDPQGHGGAALYWVHDEPLLRYLGALPHERRFDPVVFRAKDLRAEVERLRRDPQAAAGSRLGVLLGAPGPPEKTRTLTHTLWALFDMLPARSVQPPHRHSAVAVDLALEAPPGTYTLMARQLDADGQLVNPVRVDWSAGGVFITPPGWWHSHHNDSDKDAWVLPVQDAALYTYQRTLDMRFAAEEKEVTRRGHATGAASGTGFGVP